MATGPERPPSEYLSLCWLSQHDNGCPDGGRVGEAIIEAPVIVLARLGQHDRAISYGPGQTLRGRAAQSLSQAVRNGSPSPGGPKIAVKRSITSRVAKPQLECGLKQLAGAHATGQGGWLRLLQGTYVIKII